MNVIKKILLAFTIVFSLAGCDLSPSDSVKYMEEAEQHLDGSQTPTFAPNLSKNDLFVVRMLGSLINLNYVAPVLKALYGLELIDYNGPTVPLDKYIAWIYTLCIVIFFCVFVIRFVMVMMRGSQEETTTFAEDFEGLIRPCIWFGVGAILSGLFAYIVLPSLGAINNALFSNAMNDVSNNSNLPISNLAIRLTKRNDIAEAVFARKLEEKRTSYAKAVRFSKHLSANQTDLDGNDRSTTFSDFAAYQSKLTGIEYATNINKTVDWIDMVTTGIISPIWAVSKWWNAEGYVLAYQLYGKSNGGYFVDDVLNFETSNFSIGLGKDVVEFNDDFTSNDSNSLKRRNTIAAAMNFKGSIDAITALNTIQATVSSALTADDLSYVANQYPEVYNAVKADFKAAFSSVENDVLSFNTDAQRVEITASIMGLVTAAKYGINKDGTFIKIYNWLDAAGVDWLSVNCANSTFNYDNQKKALSILNGSGNSFYHDLNQWGTLDQACINPVGNKYELLTMDAVNQVAAIKVKFINAKSHAQALKIYYNIVSIAGKEAYREVVSQVTNSNNQALKKQLKGVAAAPLQLIEIVKSKHSKDVIANRIDNAVTYTYVNGNKQHNNFVDNVAVFGSPENKNYVKEADQTDILNKFPEIRFITLFDDNSLATGNIASLNQIEKNIENSYAQAIIDAFTDVVLGPVDDAMKYAGALPMNMNITDGLAYCERTDCPETFKPSLFETVVISGKKFRDAGVTCLSTIAVVKAANNVLDISDSANAAGSSGAVAAAGSTGKLGGKLIKTVSASAAAAADAASTPCYIMLAAGITNGDVMPMSYSISLIFMFYTLLVTAFAVIIIFPFMVIVDLALGGKKMEYSTRVVKHGAGIVIIPFIMLAGTLFTFALMLLQPYDIVRILLDLGFGVEAGLIAGLMSGLSLALVLPLLFKMATNVSDELVKTLLQIMNLGVNVSSASQMNNQVAQTAIGGATAGKIAQASRIAEMPIHEFVAYKKEQKKIMNDINAREHYENIQNARDQVTQRQTGDVVDEGKKLDDSVMKDPDFKKEEKKDVVKKDDDKEKDE
ncbi:hypothetical protein [Pseudomonas sp. HY7a-MNA-CIBAN-0227]|uniref:hypothetical protein n=1 Tax=Pseudomonas sp. HY7a-MNA-CIBAN-0227 TaxID=3140474 RepID=UPI0033339DFA